jgi:nicotinamide-nucleotide adenylyltransferase
VPPDQKGISAADIRSRIIDDRPWEHLVPAGVPPLIKAWNIAERLRGR